MNRTIILALVGIVVLLALGGTVYVFMRQPGQNTVGTPVTNAPAMSTNPNVAQSTPAASNSIAIQDFTFSPDAISVPKGTTVTWVNKDSAPHTVTESDTKTGPDSGTLNPGASYTYTFATAGMYHYHCLIHSQMTGTLTVTN